MCNFCISEDRTLLTDGGCISELEMSRKDPRPPSFTVTGSHLSLNCEARRTLLPKICSKIQLGRSLQRKQDQ